MQPSKLLLLISASLFLSAASLTSALASADTDYAQGLAAYNSKNYRMAAAYLQRAVNVGLSTPAIWMYLGHAYTGIGDRPHAAQAYTSLIDNFRGSPEAAQAMQYLQRLDPAAAKKAAAGPALPGAAASGVAAAPGVAVARTPFKDRLIIVPPLAGHPPVSQSMQAAIKAAMQKLPAHIYKILDDGGATVNLAPNIEDKWPGSSDMDKPRQAGTSLGEEPGRTYDHDCYIYERKKLKGGGNELGEARPLRDIVACFYHELGHAIDDCAGKLSEDPKLRAQFQLDLENMPASVSSSISYYTIVSEGLPEVIAGLLGADGHSTSACMEAMPRTKYWLKQKLKL
ncbi:tetratricopeptide repeat protein [bacterium]|nr:tetratricopeptide repeat protein [bacterium]MBP9809898.1 tetratricopeptide repeat protein [bacterium]